MRVSDIVKQHIKPNSETVITLNKVIADLTSILGEDDEEYNDVLEALIELHGILHHVLD